MITPADIRRACAKALTNERFEPTVDGTTWCNYGVHAILTCLGLGDLVWEQRWGRPMMANDMAEKLSGCCRELTFDEAFTKANEGAVIIAALKMPNHGHVAVVYPFPGRYTSGKWHRADVPCVANIGKDNGVMPLNWAFGAKPQLWLVAEPGIDKGENDEQDKAGTGGGGDVLAGDVPGEGS